MTPSRDDIEVEFCLYLWVFAFSKTQGETVETSIYRRCEFPNFQHRALYQCSYSSTAVDSIKHVYSV
jgi:hypothetical protein